MYKISEWYSVNTIKTTGAWAGIFLKPLHNQQMKTHKPLNLFMLTLNRLDGTSFKVYKFVKMVKYEQVKNIAYNMQTSVLFQAQVTLLLSLFAWFFQFISLSSFLESANRIMYYIPSYCTNTNSMPLVVNRRFSTENALPCCFQLFMFLF